MFLPELLTALIHGTGLLALLAIAFGQVERQQHWPTSLRSVVQGLVFGGGAVLAMMSPTRIEDGVMVDARALIVAFAAAFGGWPAAAIAVAVGASYRLWQGGPAAVPGAASILVAALLGLGWRYFLRPKKRIKGVHLVVLGLVVSCHLVTATVMGYASFAALVGIVAPYMVVASVSASVLLGLFVDRELTQIEREQQWKTSALTDSLTTLPNRRAFERRIARLRSGSAEAALMILDLDHFKVVNDNHGHGAGDHVLQQVSLVLRSSMRDHDMLSRLGGEELAVLLPETGAVQAMEIAERLRQKIENLSITWEGRPIAITASFGVAVAPDGVASPKLFAQADAALYAAKRGGRNRVVMSGAMLQSAPDTASFAGTVANAPSRDQAA